MTRDSSSVDWRQQVELGCVYQPNGIQERSWRHHHHIARKQVNDGLLWVIGTSSFFTEACCYGCGVACSSTRTLSALGRISSLAAKTHRLNSCILSYSPRVSELSDRGLRGGHHSDLADRRAQRRRQRVGRPDLKNCGNVRRESKRSTKLTTCSL